jgi:2-dehydropantoate 2-reductase
LNNLRTERVERIYETFANAGINTTIATDINVALWAKFLFIVSFSGIGALTGKPAGEIRNNPESRALLLKSMEEIYTLAKARGIDLPSDSIGKAMANIDSLPADGTSSMQRDVVARRPSELESQNGAVVRMAKEVGVEVPTHELIYQTLKSLETRGQ